MGYRTISLGRISKVTNGKFLDELLDVHVVRPAVPLNEQVSGAVNVEVGGHGL
ncbi:MAG: hypothetical protein ACE5JU_23410 [Candidatus Binatia bacterium]